MIRTTRTPLLLALLLLLAPAYSFAQRQPVQAPKSGDMAVSGNLGFVDAFDDDFDDFEPILTGTFEYYTSPRVSWRGLLGFTSFDADRPLRGEVDFTFVNANVVYNWKHDRVLPFVTGGIGIYSKDASPSLPPDADDTEIGLNAGGGLDLLLEPSWGIKFEGVLHGLTGEEPDAFFAGTVGAKFRF